MRAKSPCYGMSVAWVRNSTKSVWISLGIVPGGSDELRLGAARSHSRPRRT